jgi:hypothetical protein
VNNFENARAFVLCGTCVDAEPFPPPNPALHGRRPEGEVRYIFHRKGWWPILVVATFHADGSIMFEEQESGENGWFEHLPVPGEETFALDLLRRYLPVSNSELHPRFQKHPLPAFGG